MNAATPEGGTRFVTFGCRLNAFETEMMREHAAAAGLEDAIVFNTCAVTAEAVRQARQAIRRARRDNPDARIVVTGCAAQTETALFEAMPEVDHILGNAQKTRARTFEELADTAKALPRTHVTDIMEVKETAGHLIAGFGSRARAFIAIQNGCDHRCTFCIIPFGRGPSRSVPAGQVIEQIARLAGEGYREVVLTGVDITSYGADLPDRPGLGKLVKRILKDVPGLERLRLSSIDSIEADDDLIDALGAEERLMPHLHLSLQSGDDMILKRMKRRHAAADAVAFCARARAARPDIVFGADLIAGFPTETPPMFEQTLDHVRACALTYLHVFPFSPRPGTPAARMPQLPRGEVTARAERLRRAGEHAHARFLEGEKGAIRNLLVERAGLGRSEHFAKVAFGGPGEPGEVIKARITGRDGDRLIGKSLA